MQSVVVSIGGSILVPTGEDVGFIRQIAGLLESLSDRKKLYVVVGGGRYARTYIGFGRQLGASEEHLDSMGIEFTRLNADLLRLAVKDKRVPEHIPHTVEEAGSLGSEHDIVIMGGTVPGHTTDAVSAMLALEVGASLVVNATSVDGVYTADPRTDPKAQRIPIMSFEELLKLVLTAEGVAGANIPFDPKGTRILAEAKIPLIIIDGGSLESLEAAILGDGSMGTVVG